MRVIRGVARGRRLQAVPGEGTRPITDRVKEALFNIIGEDIQDASMLDLFAGTGSVGIEALSNGASYVRFVDLKRQAIQTVRSNLELTQLSTKAELFQQNALSLLESVPDCSFDYVFIAPPQYQRLWEQALVRLDFQIGWLNADAWLIVQIDPKEYKSFSLMGALPLQPSPRKRRQEHSLELKNIKEFDQRRYGDTLLVFYQKLEHIDQESILE